MSGKSIRREPCKREDLAERSEDLGAELRAAQEFRKKYDCPSEFEGWLRSHIIDQYGAEPSWHTERFLRDAEDLGLVRAVLMNMNQDDADGKERRRGATNCLPDTRIAFEVIQYALNHADPYWRTIAAKWLPNYAPTPDAAIELLRELLHDDVDQVRFHAALHLSQLAPGEPGLVDVLIEAVKTGWVASWARNYQDCTSGPDEAIEALERLGPMAATALPTIRAEIEADHVKFGPALRTYMALGGDPAELAELLPRLRLELPNLSQSEGLANALRAFLQLGGRLDDMDIESAEDQPNLGRYSWQLMNDILALPSETPGRIWFLSKYFHYIDWINDGPVERQLLRVLTDEGHAEELLPAFARRLDATPSFPTLELLGHLVDLLTRISKEPENRTPEDVWVAALCGQPSHAPVWLVYADWLDERGDGRGAMIRQFAAGIAPGEWSIDYAAGWATVLNQISADGCSRDLMA